MQCINVLQVYGVIYVRYDGNPLSYKSHQSANIHVLFHLRSLLYPPDISDSMVILWLS